MVQENYFYRAVTPSELELSLAPSNLNSIKELAEAIQNISLTPGPQGEQGPQGESGVSAEVVFQVQGGTLGTQPTFSGNPLFSGSYIKSGSLVNFQIQVDMDNITSFGTGQYFIDLPFPSKYAQKFRDGCLHDISASKDYEVGAHVNAGASRLILTSIDTQSGTVFDIPFTYNHPVVLSTADNFHISGTYIATS
jgi:hypothetical protein